MKKLLQKLLCALLTLALTVAPAMMLSATAATANPESDFEYFINGDIAYLTNYVGTAERVVVPATLGGKPVERIHSFGANKNVVSVTLPDTVRVIGQYAFVNCSSLSEVHLPEGLLTIEVSAFGGQTLRSIHIPSTTSYIDNGVFALCGLEEITVADGNPYYYVKGNCLIERKSEAVVQGCKTSVIPDGVKTIRYGAFCGTDVTEIVIPDSVRTIEDYAFYSNRTLTSVTLGSGVQTIGNDAFCATGLTEIHIPANVVTMGEDVFFACTELTDITCDLPFRTGSWNENWLRYCSATVHWNVDAAIMGDLNANGAIDSFDYLLLKRHCLNTF